MNRHRASDGMPGDRQGLHVQPGGGGRVEATLSVRTHGARRRRLRQGISQIRSCATKYVRHDSDMEWTVRGAAPLPGNRWVCWSVVYLHAEVPGACSGRCRSGACPGCKTG